MATRFTFDGIEYGVVDREAYKGDYIVVTKVNNCWVIPALREIKDVNNVGDYRVDTIVYDSEISWKEEEVFIDFLPGSTDDFYVVEPINYAPSEIEFPKITKESLNFTPQSDDINHPAHYTFGNTETQDYIDDVVQHYEDSAIAAHVSNAIKYLSRAPHKGTHDKDLRKALFFIKRAVGRLDG